MKLLLDNSAVNHLVNDDNTFSNFYFELERLLKKEKLLLTATPTNVIEISLFPEEQFLRRNAVAKAFNNLIEGVRIISDFEFNTLHNIVNRIKIHFPDSVNDDTVVGRLASESVYPFIALIGQMAAIPNFEFLGPFRNIRKSKLATTLAQYYFITEPDVFIPELINQAQGKTVSDEVKKRLLEIDELTVEELKEKIENIKSNARRNKDLTRLQKNKEELIRQYTAHFLFEAFKSCFFYYEDLLNLFDFKKIVENWSKPFPGIIQDHFITLPPNIISSMNENGTYMKDTYYQIIELICKRYSNGLIPDVFFSTQGFFDEFEKNLRNPQDLSEGLSIDLNYLSILNRVDVFITLDQAQARAAEKYASHSKNDKMESKPLIVLKSLKDFFDFSRGL